MAVRQVPPALTVANVRATAADIQGKNAAVIRMQMNKCVKGRMRQCLGAVSFFKTKV